MAVLAIVDHPIIFEIMEESSRFVLIARLVEIHAFLDVLCQETLRAEIVAVSSHDDDTESTTGTGTETESCQSRKNEIVT